MLRVNDLLPNLGTGFVDLCRNGNTADLERFLRTWLMEIGANMVGEDWPREHREFAVRNLCSVLNECLDRSGSEYRLPTDSDAIRAIVDESETAHKITKVIRALADADLGDLDGE